MYAQVDSGKRRYSIRIWKMFTDVFNCMPVAALIDSRILCMHGGLSPDIKNSLDEIGKIAKPSDIPERGLLCDLLWSDPDRNVEGWGENERGVSYTFGEAFVESFCRKHDLDLICRAHQVVEEGYEFFSNRRLITVFSAPNYCNQFENSAALLAIDQNLNCSVKMLKPAQQRISQIIKERQQTPPRMRNY